MFIILETLLKLFDRDLQRLEEEINLFQSEEALWRISGEIKNPTGNLCLHLCGNLQHYIGANLGRTSYVRNRDNEFAAKNISKADLIAEVQKTKQVVREALETLKPSILESEYPEKVFDYPMTTAYFLIHLNSHLNYHLGQINYHRRLVGQVIGDPVIGDRSAAQNSVSGI
jgi:uncharacterized damage-inducible protein DinB